MAGTRGRCFLRSEVALEALDVEVGADEADGTKADEVDIREDGDEEAEFVKTAMRKPRKKNGMSAFAFIMLMTIA